MFAKLIFISLILQLTEATRPAGRTRSEGECTSLGAAGCATCSTGDNGETCLTCENPDEFIQLDEKGCKPACNAEGEVEDSAAVPKVCKCNEKGGYKPQGGKCVKGSEGECKTENCQECTNKGTANEVCTKCISTHYLTPTNQCVPNCTTISGYYGDNADKKCKKCNSECAECVGSANNQCSACPAGMMLQYTDASIPAYGGTCVGQCSVSATGEGYEVCGARIGGTDYCSKCKGSQVPINGVCAANPSARAPACTSNGQGVCTGCTGDYFLRDGGCYKTDRLPGKSICTQAANGQCNQCANGLQAQGGACGACHSTCATCSAADAAEKCKTCATGYYKTSDNEGSCKKCSEKIPGCKQCTSSSAGSVICLESEAGTGGSTNKSGGLPPGAIAGIAVAVIIVVGGLVGFLCWWFLCRGKA
ncbi:VSP with INR [Giardia lamblia P15]|uniref:VSP with INR n=1 Tax=Giardia intestinalis (strain P15) TaxID=658858 RepID=E1F5Q7_GIAIA|nr:VSP with INR [Giardia lamblia P15]